MYNIAEGFMKDIKQATYDKILIRTIIKSKIYKDLVEKTRSIELRLLKSLTVPTALYNKISENLSTENYPTYMLNILNNKIKEDKNFNLVLYSNLKPLITIDRKNSITFEKLETNFYKQLENIIAIFKQDVNSLIIMITMILVFFITSYSAITIKSKLKASKSMKNHQLTNKMREIVGDNNINVYMYIDSSFNALNIGTPDLFFSSEVPKLCTEREIIAVLLHEYGHYAVGKLYRGGTQVAVSGMLMVAMALLLRMIFKKKLENSPQFYAIVNIISIYIGVILGIGGLSAINKILRKPEEHIADSYAIKYGYGEEERRVDAMLLKRFKDSFCYALPPGQSCEEYIEKFYKSSTHPSGIKRLEFVEKLMKNSKVQKLLKAGSKLGVIKWVRLVGKLLIEYYSKRGAN